MEKHEDFISIPLGILRDLLSHRNQSHRLARLIEGSQTDHFHLDESISKQAPLFSNRPSTPTVSPTRKIYRFEPVRHRNMRVVGVERLLEPPIPTPRAVANPWDNDDDYYDGGEWVDEYDFEEPNFPQVRTTTASRRGAATPSILSQSMFAESSYGMETSAGWSSSQSRGKTEDRRHQVGFSVDSDGYDDDDAW